LVVVLGRIHAATVMAVEGLLRDVLLVATAYCVAVSPAVFASERAFPNTPAGCVAAVTKAVFPFPE